MTNIRLQGTDRCDNVCYLVIRPGGDTRLMTKDTTLLALSNICANAALFTFALQDVTEMAVGYDELRARCLALARVYAAGLAWELLP